MSVISVYPNVWVVWRPFHYFSEIPPRVPNRYAQWASYIWAAVVSGIQPSTASTLSAFCQSPRWFDSGATHNNTLRSRIAFSHALYFQYIRLYVVVDARIMAYVRTGLDYKTIKTVRCLLFPTFLNYTTAYGLFPISIIHNLLSILDTVIASVKRSTRLQRTKDESKKGSWKIFLLRAIRALLLLLGKQ